MLEFSYYTKAEEKKIEEAKEKSQKKRELLQKQFVEKMQKNKQKNTKEDKLSNQTSINENLKQKANEEKKKRVKLEKKIKELEKKLKDEKRDNQILKLEKREIKEKLFTEQTLKKDWIEKEKEQREKATELEKGFERQKTLIKDLRKSQKETTIQSWKKKNDQLSKEIMHLKSTIQERDRKIHRLHQQLTIKKTLDAENTDKKNEQRIQMLLKELRFHKTKIQELESGLTIPYIIRLLKENLTYETAPEYIIEQKNPFGPLGSDVSNYIKKRKKNEENKPKEYQAMTEAFTKGEKIKFEEIKEPEAVMGYLSHTKKGWYFFDLDYEAYEVELKGNQTKLKDEKPVKAIITKNNKAQISHIYDIEPLDIQEKRRKRSQNVKNQTKDRKEYPYLGDFTVLMVGSRNKNAYMERLKKHGITALWHNPFEESYQRLNSRYRQADIVILCTSHISHSVMDHIDKREEKVEMVDKDNEETIIARIKLNASQRNLLKEEIVN